MDVRTTLEKYPRTAGGIAIIVILAAVGFCVGLLLMGDHAGHKAWFTDDDGKTWFADDSNKFTPFDHNGHQAVMCFVYTCDGGKTKFVSHLLRISVAGRKQIQEVMDKRNAGDKSAGIASLPMEVKLPGVSENGWVSASDPSGKEMMVPHCPNGTMDNLEMVDPND